MPVTFQTFASLLNDAEIKLRIEVHGPVVDALVGPVRIGDIERTDDGVACDLAFDSLGLLKQLCGVLAEADVLDIEVTTRENEK